jgi:hypothetical protein
LNALTFGRNYHALSARSFNQAEIPLGLAFRLYDAFSAAVQRKCTCSAARSLAGIGGLPLGRFGFSMPDIVPTQIILDKPPAAIYSVYTVNTEGQMTKGRRLPIHVVVAKLKRGEKLFVLDYGHYEFEDGSKPGQGVVSTLRNAGRLEETYPDGTRIGAVLVLKDIPTPDAND